jgi:hypothetical protein
MALRRRLAAVVAGAYACGAFAIVHATAAAPQAKVSATPKSHVTLIANADHLLIPYTPTPVPTPASTPVPMVHQAASVPAVAPAPPVSTPRPAPLVRRDWLTSGDGTLSTRVGVYTDCSGATELTHASAAIDTCISGPMYFVGHNVGVFTPLMHMGVGSIITYFDGDDVAHVWRVVSVRPDWRAANGAPPPTQPDVVAQFQTCAVPDASIDRILDVVPA